MTTTTNNMSSKRFKITLHLEHFFRDHRSSARIFINEKIHTIKDLCLRISDIFNIRNFYLTCENQYLPPSEDIEILQPNEKVWVRPHNFLEWQHESFVNKNVFNNDEKCEINTSVVKQKRKKTKVPDDIDESLDDVPKKKKKKKKPKHDDEDDFSIINMFLQNNTGNNTVLTTPEVPKKIKKSKKEDCFQEKRIKSNKISTSCKDSQFESTQMGDSNIEKEEKCESNAINQEIEKKIVSQNPKVNIIENKIINFSTDHIFEKRDNYINGIVKSLEKNSEFSIKQTSTPIMNNSDLRNDTKKVMPANFDLIKNNVNGDSAYTINTFNTEKSTSITEKDTISIIDDSNSYLENDDTVSTISSKTSFENLTKSIRPSMLKMSIGPFVELLKQEESNNIDESFITKRKRKRVRHRKRKTVSETKMDVQQNCEHNVEYTTTPVFVPLHKPQIHIRFNDNEENGDAVEELVTNKSHICESEISQQNSQTKVDFKPDMEETEENQQSTQLNIDYGNTKALSDEQIKNCAEINFPPKTGNVISFKILRISEMYTPEISAFITAKVLDLKEENQEVLLEIIRGNEQFAEPEGKFSLEQLSVEGESKKEEKVNTVTINWSNLIDVRLLSN